jgi:hypothetical protein
MKLDMMVAVFIPYVNIVEKKLCKIVKEIGFRKEHIWTKITAMNVLATVMITMLTKKANWYAVVQNVCLILLGMKNGMIRKEQI